MAQLGREEACGTLRTTLAEAVTNVEGNVPIAKLLLELNHLDIAIKEGQLNNIKNIIEELYKNCISVDLIATLYNNKKQICITQNHLIKNVLTANVDNKLSILRYLLYDTDIIHYLKNPHIDKNVVDKERTDVFSAAIRTNDSGIIEMLYDFWCNKSHWAIKCSNDNDNNVTDNIERVGLSLVKACEQCEDFLTVHQQINVNSNCLRTFNNFQFELNTELQKLTSQSLNNCDTNNNVKNMIHTVLRVYKKYSNIDMVRLKKSSEKHEQIITKSFSDKMTIYNSALLYIMYEVYFRKLDLYVSLLILKNLGDLKQSLAASSEFIKKIESTIYYFIYRAKDDWRLHLPNGKQIVKEIDGIHNGKDIRVDVAYDEDKLFRGLIQFLEREHFNKFLNDFEHLLGKVQVEKGNITSEPAHDNMNYPSLLCYMRNDYFLKRVIYIIETVACDREVLDETILLNIKQFIQEIKVDEMLQKFEVSLYLLEEFYTRISLCLLQVKYSIKMIKELHALGYGQETVAQLINTVNNKKNEDLADLKRIQNELKSIRCINKIILEMFLLEKTSHILDERICNLPHTVKPYIEDISKTLDQDQQNVLAQMWPHFASKTGFSIQLLKEIMWITQTTKYINQEKENINIDKDVIEIIRRYFTSLKTKQSREMVWQNLQPSIIREVNILTTLCDKETHDENYGRKIDNIKMIHQLLLNVIKVSEAKLNSLETSSLKRQCGSFLAHATRIKKLQQTNIVMNCKQNKCFKEDGENTKNTLT